ncbi:MAG: Ig-like domain-containing protein, partial [Deltaproteobacteria bacterium]
VMLTAPAEGNLSVTLSAQDAAGNAPSVAALTVLVDLSFPILSIERTGGAPFLDGARFGPQAGNALPYVFRADSLAATATVLPGGSTARFARGGGTYLGTLPLLEGTNLFTWRTTDEVGRASTLSRTLVYDTTPPTGSLDSPAEGARVRGALDLAASATDALSGVALVEFQVDGGLPFPAAPAPDGVTWIAPLTTVASVTTPGLADGVHTITASFTDGAGNRATSSHAILVDNTPPVASLVALPALVSGLVDVIALATDAGSGIAALSISVNGAVRASCAGVTTCTASVDTTTLLDGPFVMKATATDAAGNVSTPAQSTAIADNTAPSHFLRSPVAGTEVSGPFAISVVVSDPGFASTECSVDGVSLGRVLAPTFDTLFAPSGIDGALLVRCAVTDLAGNVGVETSTVTLRRWKYELEPESIKLRSVEALKTAALEVSGVGADALVPTSARDLKLVIPGGEPVPVLTGPGLTRVEYDHGKAEVKLRVDRAALVASLRAGLSAGVIDPRKRVTVKLYDGARYVGSTQVKVVP